MAPTASPTNPKSTHHVTFKDSAGYKIGLIAAAQIGDAVERELKLLSRSPIDRTAMKTSSGDTEYSDWRPPYYALKQDDFSGGRGQEEFTKDRTKFFDSGGLNTRKGGQLILNGQEQLSGLLRNGGQIQPGNMAQPSVPTPTSTEWATECSVDASVYDEVTYDDTNAGWTYTGAGWTTGTVTGLYGGTNHYTNGAGDYAEFTFTGTNAVFIYTKQTNRASFKVYIDTILQATVNANGAESFQVEWDSGALANAEHTIKIEQSGSGYIDVDALRVTSSGFDQVWFWHHSDTAISGVKIYDGNDAAFATLLQTCPNSIPPSFAPGWHIINLTSPVDIADTESIWISIPLGATDKYSPDDAITGYLKQAGVPVADNGFPCRVVVKKEPSFSRLFKYHEMMFLCQIIDGTTHIWRNGYNGLLSIGGTKSVTDNTYSGTWTTNELVGGIFIILSGTGFGQHQRWRKILTNTSTGDITFEDPFDIALSTDTYYVIVGLDNWTEIGSHGLSAYVHDILVSDEAVVYFAQGSGFSMRKMNIDFATAVMSWAADDATSSASSRPRYLTQVGRTIWGVENGASFQAKSAPAGTTAADAWSNARTWITSPIVCGDRISPFTGLMTYVDGSGYKAPMIFKEGEFGFITNGQYDKVQLDEMKVLSGARNGRAILAHDTNAYFSFGSGLERWYYPNLDDIGPNKDEGLPEERAGDIRCMAGYPGKFFIGVDAGDTGYSSVLSSGGWHEEWRGAYGQRIQSVMPQSVPGTTLDRLWIAAGGDLLWIPMPSDTGNPLNDSNMLYTAGGYVDTSAYYTELKTALKYISLIKFIFKSIQAEQYMEVQYKLNDGDWADLDDTTNPTTDDDATITYNMTNVVSSTPYYGLEAYSIRLRIKLFTTDKTVTPNMLAMVMEGLARISNKYSYSIPFLLEDNAFDLNTDRETDSSNALTTADGKLSKLVTWSTTGPLFMESKDIRFHEKMVLALPFAENLIEFTETDGKKLYLGLLTLQDA